MIAVIQNDFKLMSLHMLLVFVVVFLVIMYIFDCECNTYCCMICFDIHEFPLIYKKYYCGVCPTPLKINSGVLSQHPIFSGVLPSRVLSSGVLSAICSLYQSDLYHIFFFFALHRYMIKALVLFF